MANLGRVGGVGSAVANLGRVGKHSAAPLAAYDPMIDGSQKLPRGVMLPEYAR